MDYTDLDSDDESDDDQWAFDEAADPIDNVAVHFGGTAPDKQEDPEELYYQYRRAWRRWRKSIGKPFSRRSGRFNSFKGRRAAGKSFRSRTFFFSTGFRKRRAHYQELALGDSEPEPP